MTADMEGVPAELLEQASPHTDIHLLFQHYNSVYFDNALGATRVEWSSARMTRFDPETAKNISLLPALAASLVAQNVPA